MEVFVTEKLEISPKCFLSKVQKLGRIETGLLLNSLGALGYICSNLVRKKLMWKTA